MITLTQSAIVTNYVFLILNGVREAGPQGVHCDEFYNHFDPQTITFKEYNDLIDAIIETDVMRQDSNAHLIWNG